MQLLPVLADWPLALVALSVASVYVSVLCSKWQESLLPQMDCATCYDSRNLVSCRNNTHTRFTALFPRLPRWAGTSKVKPIWILLKQETMSGSSISWAVCKSAPSSRQPCQHPITQFFTGRMPFLPPNQQRQSTEGKSCRNKLYNKSITKCSSGVTWLHLTDLYTVIHNYGNPWFLLYSLWINRHKVIKFSTYV